MIYLFVQLSIYADIYEWNTRRISQNIPFNVWSLTFIQTTVHISSVDIFIKAFSIILFHGLSGIYFHALAVH